MKTVVCVKQVAHIYTGNGIDPKTGNLVTEGLVHVLNPCDEVAVEEALRIREASGGGHVTVVTLGPSRAEAALRWCFAMGADEGIHIVDEAGYSGDPWTVSRVLSGVIKPLDYDLILFGKIAADDCMGQVGTFVSELLDLPVVSAVTRLELHRGEGRAVLQRALERGNREVVECPLPAAFTVEKSLNKPRYPTVPGRRAARTKTVRKVGLQELSGSDSQPDGGAMIETVRLAPPKIRPKKILAPDDGLSAAGRLKWIMSGGVGEKKGGQIGGEPEKLARSITDFLKERKFIPV